MLPLLRKASSASIVKCVERARIADQERRSTMDLCRCEANSVDPGYTATDLNQHRGTQSIPEGAAEIIRLALLPGDGLTGTFSNAQGIVPW